MKWGILISLVIIIAFAGLFVFNLRGVPDNPTSATAPEKLRQVALPAELPNLYTSTHPERPSTEAYYEAVNFFIKNKGRFTGENPQWSLVEELTNHLLTAMDQGPPQQGFLDKYIPMEPAASPKFGAAVELIPEIVLTSAQETYEEGNKTRALDATRAVFAFGQRMYTHNTRFYNRYNGLQTMGMALSQMGMWREDMPDGGEQLQQWSTELDTLSQYWHDKTEIVKNLRGHVADTVNIALNDEELTFRIAATLNLGVLKFAPGSKGNARLIEDALEKLKNDPNDLVRQAAEVAQNVKRDEINMMR